MNEPSTNSLDERILVLAPTARDTLTCRNIFQSARLEYFPCQSIAEIGREMQRGAGAAIVTVEAILGDKDQHLRQCLKAQPPWSDFPLLVLTLAGLESSKTLQALDSVGHMTLMKRPVQVATFLSMIQSCLRDRRRQYAVRDLLAERRQVNDALRQERERYRVTLRSIGDGVIATDTEGKVTFVNEVAERLTGWNAPEAQGRSLEEVVHMVHETTRQCVPNPAIRALKEDVVVGLENYTVLISRDGTECLLDDSAAPIRGADGSIVGSVLTFRDVTQRKKTEEALKEADRRKDDFIALLAHELRNPLAPLRSGLQVLRLASSNVKALAQARSMMDRQLNHMVRLIDDLLDISRIGRNKMELRRGRVLLADIISNAVETARPMIEASGHELSVSVPAQPIFLDADLTRLSQVFSNLLSNSAKYTVHGGHIWLHAELGQGEVIVSVRDTGIGIPPDALDSIFDMFSQIDRSIERSTGGLGIGLALVKGLVEMHGGTVSAKSPGQDQGSTFTVRLPILEIISDTMEILTVDNIPNVRSAKRRLLVVDDNRDSATSMEMMLSLLGFEITLAHDGIEAVQKAERTQPDIILMDVGMPRLNGLDATRQIRSQPWGQSMIVIALTGWGQEGDRIQSKEAGCDGHLVKPVNLTDLEKMLAELTAKSPRCGHPISSNSYQKS